LDRPASNWPCSKAVVEPGIGARGVPFAKIAYAAMKILPLKTA
jgi:hypothetical protein